MPRRRLTPIAGRRGPFDAGDDLDRTTATRAGFDVHLEDPLELEAREIEARRWHKCGRPGDEIDSGAEHALAIELAKNIREVKSVQSKGTTF